MPVRNEHNAIIFAGTMGLIRKSVLEEIGGWDDAYILLGKSAFVAIEPVSGGAGLQHAKRAARTNGLPGRSGETHRGKLGCPLGSWTGRGANRCSWRIAAAPGPVRATSIRAI